MENLSHLEEQKTAIVHFACVFLKQNFSFSPQSVKVLMDNHLVVIQADNFLSPAEIEMGMEKRNTRLIHEMYSELFHKVKSPLVNQIEHVTSREVLSSQISISIETKIFIMTFFLASNSIIAGN